MTDDPSRPSPPHADELGESGRSAGRECFATALATFGAAPPPMLTVLEICRGTQLSTAFDGAISLLSGTNAGDDAAAHPDGRCSDAPTAAGTSAARSAPGDAIRTDGAQIRCRRTLHYVMAVPPNWNAEARQQLNARIQAVFGQPGELSAIGLRLSRNRSDAAMRRLALPGLHRFASDCGRLTLTIASGEPSALVGDLRARVDLLLLADGEAVNPSLARSLARLADEAAVLGIWQTDAASRAALRAAGFVFGASCSPATSATAAGSEPIAQPAVARFAPRWQVRRHSPPQPFEVTTCSERVAAAPAGARATAHGPPKHAGIAGQRAGSPRAIVVGAGVAGTALTERLAANGWLVQLFERRAGVGQGASGNPAGVFHPALAQADTPLTRLSRAAFELALQRWPALERHGLVWHPDGLVQLDADGTISNACRRLGWDGALSTALSPDAASALLGIPVESSGLLLAHSGWLAPASLCEANLRAAGERASVHFKTRIAGLERTSQGSWRAFDDRGHCVGVGDIVLIANAGDAARLLAPPNAPVESFRGQISRFETGARPVPLLPVTGDGYVSPCEGGFIAGASYARGDDEGIVVADHLANLRRAAGLSPAFAPLTLDAVTDGRAGLRSAVADHLPMIGAIADLDATRRAAHRLQGARLVDIPRAAGCYAAFAFGSRGLLWSVLAAEVIVAMLDGSPAPVEAPLLDAIDPGRYVVRALRNRSL